MTLLVEPDNHRLVHVLAADGALLPDGRFSFGSLRSTLLPPGSKNVLACRLSDCLVFKRLPRPGGTNSPVKAGCPHNNTMGRRAWSISESRVYVFVAH